jgi:NADH-quinone oxidoreductase subunit G
MGQTRGAQSGEADRHSVWLAAQNLEPKLSPFDPFAILDEIQRLVPGYQVSRLELLAGNDVHVQSSLVQIETGPERHALILPAQDTLFTSGSLTRYSTMLQSVLEAHSTKPTETAAD